jgi:micrococcal nuclease
MRNVATRLVILVALLIPLKAEEFTGKVVGVSDGDTITVLTGRLTRRVRLDGIDAPEANQAFGQRAKQAASRSAFGRVVRVICHGEDRYGRSLGEVLLPDGSKLNERMVADGWAWHYKRYSNDSRLAELEETARRRRVGLWSDPHAIPPWEFRESKRKAALIGRQ